LFPIVLTLTGIFTALIPVQPEKALTVMVVTLNGMVTLPVFPAGQTIKVLISWLYKTPSIET
jgi:hypothetical protein